MTMALGTVMSVFNGVPSGVSAVSLVKRSHPMVDLPNRHKVTIGRCMEGKFIYSTTWISGTAIFRGRLWTPEETVDCIFWRSAKRSVSGRHTHHEKWRWGSWRWTMSKSARYIEIGGGIFDRLVPGLGRAAEKHAMAITDDCRDSSRTLLQKSEDLQFHHFTKAASYFPTSKKHMPTENKTKSFSNTIVTPQKSPKNSQPPRHLAPQR